MADDSGPMVDFPASHGQVRVAEAGHDPARHGVRVTVDVRGPVDRTRLEEAINRVVSGHEILRTELRADGASGRWKQVVQPVRHIPVEEGVQATPSTDRSVPLRVGITSDGDGSRLHFEGSGLHIDARALHYLVEELATAYQTGVGPSEDSVLQYGDFAEWQAELSESEEGESGRAFWRTVSLPDSPADRLPFERKGEPNGSGASQKRVRRKVDAHTAASSSELAASSAVSEEVLLLAVFFVVLWRYTGRMPVVVDVRSDGRGLDDLSGAIGPHSLDLPVHAALDASSSFKAFAGRVAEAVAAGREWEHVFQPALLSSRPAGAALGESRFGFEYGVAPEVVGSDGVTFHVSGQQVGRGDHRLRLACWRWADGLFLDWVFDPDRIDDAYVDGMSRAFEAVLAAAVSNPDAYVSELPLLDEEGRRSLVEDPNDTQRPYPTDSLIHDFIERHARERPDAPAVEMDGSVLTYGALNGRANRLAHHLRGLGVGPGTLVAILAERSFEMVESVLAVLKAGGGYVPLSPTYPPERLAFIMEQTRAPVLIATVGVEDLLPETHARIVRMDEDLARELEAHSEQAPERVATPDDVAYVIYTSGSTGQPKGVVVTHRTFVISNEARVEYYGPGEGRFLLLSPFAFDSSIVGLFWTLTGGGTLCLIAEGSQRDVGELCRMIDERAVTHTLTLPSFYDMIITHGEVDRLQGLEAVVVAGEACPLTMVRRHKEALPGTGLFSEYGATETTIWSSAYDCLEQTIDTAPLGRPIANCEMYVLDEDLQPLPVGVPGEVHFGGAILARGYWNRPDLTEERFVASPFRDDPDARLYKSGDLARWLPGGDLEFLGRVDNQVKIRGFRVELEEIEVILGTHPDLAEVAVAARSASEWDRGHEESDSSPTAKRLVAYVVPRSAPGPSSSELRDYLASRVPSYMVPSAFLHLEGLPRTPNGKLDRDALPAVDPAKLEQPQSRGDAPATAVEEALAQIWQRVLGVDEVSREDNFFELGGDSILSIQVVALANKQGLKISARDVFEGQTIARLAEASGAGDAVETEQVTVTGAVPLHPIQHWFFEQDRPDPHHANMAVMLRCSEPLDLEALRSAVEALLHHHDALRTAFHREGGRWRQEVLASVSSNPVRRVDLSATDPATRSASIEDEAAEVQRQLDLESADLVRVVYFDCGPDDAGRLLVVIHHLVFDGVSLRILLEDLEEAYRDLISGRGVGLPLKTTSYKRWNEALVAYADSPELLAELDRWRSLLPAQVQDLPRDTPEDARSNTFADQAVVERSLSADMTRKLVRDVPAARDARTDEVLLAALTGTVCTWTDRPGLHLELEGHGRELFQEGVDPTRTVGWFTTVYPAHVEFGGDDPEAELASVRDAVRSIPNKGFGYGILRHMGDEPVRVELAAAPRAAVNFNYMGRFDSSMGGGLFEPAPESTGPDFSPKAQRPHELEIVATVVDGTMKVEWMFSRGLHDRATIEELADDFEMRLERLIDASVPGEVAPVSDDFSDFDWDDSDVSDIAAALERARGAD